MLSADCFFSRLFAPLLAEGDIRFHLAFAAIEGDMHGIAGAVAVHYVRHILLVLDILAVNGDD